MDRHARYGILTYLKQGEQAVETDPWRTVTGALARIGQYGHGEAKRKEIVKEAEEISTYTPRGKIIYLPEESMVLDFAYRVHTDLGDRCTGATIYPDRSPVRPSHRLEDGDIVTIIKSDETLDVLDITIEDRCRSDRARIAIKNLIAKQRKNFARVLGKELVNNAMAAKGISLEKVAPDTLGLILEILNARDMEDLFVRVGLGVYSPKIIIFYIKNMIGKGKDGNNQKGSTHGIEINRLNPTLFKFSNCCDPYPGEKAIVGILTEKGVSLHLGDCGELDRHRVEQADKFPIRWADSALGQKVKGKILLPTVRDPSRTMEVIREWAQQTGAWGFKCHATLNRKATKFLVSHDALPTGHLARLLIQFPRATFHWKLVWAPLQKFGTFSPHIPPNEEFTLYQQHETDLIQGG